MQIKRSVSVASPATEPITLTTAKKHLEIAQGDDSHDTHVQDLISEARAIWEHDTQQLLESRQVVEKLDCWPDCDWRFYYRPVESINSITYYDESNALQTLDASVYSLDGPNRQLHLAVDQSWPSIESRWDAITITYTCGASDLPSKRAIKLQLSMMFGDDQTAKEYEHWERAYNAMVERYQRSSYP